MRLIGDPSKVSYVRGPLRLTGLRCTLRMGRCCSLWNPVTHRLGHQRKKRLPVEVPQQSMLTHSTGPVPLWLAAIVHSGRSRHQMLTDEHAFPNTEHLQRNRLTCPRDKTRASMRGLYTPAAKIPSMGVFCNSHYFYGRSEVRNLKLWSSPSTQASKVSPKR